ncbi:hypothetical protein ACFY7Y_31780 [Streptomyces virginiae]|uniref:hypothetical protein n=1 Tax=Streptomyces virginiae TaxID=1961 RepID=UPI002DDBE3B4|nr:hypothetical protein [Streptomyces virginiae]WSC77313.1 hypothetical protein OHA56_13795 [Streptomyces virginiae]
MNAVTGSGEIRHPIYLPMEGRWERANALTPPSDVAHAYSYLSTTLCGLPMEEMSASPYPWVPSWDSACPACKGAAEIIDARWPLEKRDWKVTVSTDPDSLPF